MFCSCAHREGKEDRQGIRQFILKLVTKWRWSVLRPGSLVSEERANGTYRVRWMAHIFGYTPICPAEHDKQRTPHPWNVPIHTEVLKIHDRDCTRFHSSPHFLVSRNHASMQVWHARCYSTIAQKLSDRLLFVINHVRWYRYHWYVSRHAFLPLEFCVPRQALDSNTLIFKQWNIKSVNDIELQNFNWFSENACGPG